MRDEIIRYSRMLRDFLQRPRNNFILHVLMTLQAGGYFTVFTLGSLWVCSTKSDEIDCFSEEHLNEFLVLTLGIGFAFFYILSITIGSYRDWRSVAKI